MVMLDTSQVIRNKLMYKITGNWMYFSRPENRLHWQHLEYFVS